MACLITLGCAQLQGMYCQEISGNFSNGSGSARGCLEGGWHPCLEKLALFFPHRPLRPGLTMGSGPEAIAGCPAGVYMGPSPFLQGARLTSRHSEPSKDKGTGPSVFTFLSFAHSGRGTKPWPPGLLGQGFWKVLREADGKAMGFGSQRWWSVKRSHSEATSLNFRPFRKM